MATMWVIPANREDAKKPKKRREEAINRFIRNGP